MDPGDKGRMGPNTAPFRADSCLPVMAGHGEAPRLRHERRLDQEPSFGTRLQGLYDLQPIPSRNLGDTLRRNLTTAEADSHRGSPSMSRAAGRIEARRPARTAG